MLSASEAVTQNYNTALVETEISLLNQAILASNKLGGTSATLTKTSNTAVASTYVIGSPMTLDSNYFQTWQNIITDAHRTGELNTVIKNFQGLGYTINRKSDDGTTMFWVVNWA